MSELDPYRTLQVERGVDHDAIRTAYRKLARQNHPDLAPGPEAAARMAAINVAWELIGEPAARRRFDRERGVRPSEPAGGAAPPASSAPTTPASSAPATPTWTTGRSSAGGGYEASMHTADGIGAAGRPPGRPSGSVLNFGRYAGWSLGEIARTDLEFLEWLDRMPIGRPYRDEIDHILRGAGRRQSAAEEASARRGLYRRR